MSFNGPDATSLSLLQRILLGTDGTVTDILEAFAGEPIEVVKLSQALGPWDGEHPALELTRHEPVIRRRVVLVGVESRSPLLHGDSVIACSRIHPHVFAGLMSADRPIGRLLFESRTETFREILTWGREPAGPAGAVRFGVDPCASMLRRTYRVLAASRPIMVITERFPASFFLDAEARRDRPELVEALGESSRCGS